MTTATVSRESFAGKRQAEDCPDCQAARGGEDLTGWQLHSDGYLHNHLRGAGRASANPAFERWRKELEAEVGQRMAFARRTATEAGLTPQEIVIAKQMGLSEQQVLAQKQRDQKEE